jgi:teichuronic acid biosynthesis glycosyltransferase TuaC
LEDAGCQMEYFDVVGKGLWGYLKNISGLRRRVREFNPSVLHAHFVFSGILSSLALTGKPVITSLMGSDINDSGSFFLWLIRLFARFIWKGTIVKTNRLFSKLNYSKARVIPNGVNMELFKPLDKGHSLEQLGWQGKDYHIVFGSNPARTEKNYELFLDALNQISEEFDNVQVHHLHGLNRREVSLYYNAADVLVLTSVREGSPNAIKEAMACNCPIIATDVGDIREVVNNTTGCFVTGFSPLEIADGLRQALTNRKRTDGRENIAWLDSKIISQKIVGIYKELSGSL